MISKISEKIIPKLLHGKTDVLNLCILCIYGCHSLQSKRKSSAAYVVLGINLYGQKDILGIWIEENESSKFWLNVLNELKTRGVKDVFLSCVDRLTGFKEAIAAYTKAQIQKCIIHQIRISTRFISYKHIKPLMVDLKTVY